MFHLSCDGNKVEAGVMGMGFKDLSDLREMMGIKLSLVLLSVYST